MKTKITWSFLAFEYRYKFFYSGGVGVANADFSLTEQSTVGRGLTDLEKTKWLQLVGKERGNLVFTNRYTRYTFYFPQCCHSALLVVASLIKY